MKVLLILTVLTNYGVSTIDREVSSVALCNEIAKTHEREVKQKWEKLAVVVWSCTPLKKEA